MINHYRKSKSNPRFSKIKDCVVSSEPGKSQTGDCLVHAIGRQFEALMKIRGFIKSEERFDITRYSYELEATWRSSKLLKDHVFDITRYLYCHYRQNNFSRAKKLPRKSNISKCFNMKGKIVLSNMSLSSKSTRLNRHPNISKSI
ncbi:unnamed protein product [Cochlearia groenlandica]